MIKTGGRTFLGSKQCLMVQEGFRLKKPKLLCCLGAEAYKTTILVSIAGSQTQHMNLHMLYYHHATTFHPHHHHADNCAYYFSCYGFYKNTEVCLNIAPFLVILKIHCWIQQLLIFIHLLVY